MKTTIFSFMVVFLLAVPIGSWATDTKSDNFPLTLFSIKSPGISSRLIYSILA